MKPKTMRAALQPLQKYGHRQLIRIKADLSTANAMRALMTERKGTVQDANIESTQQKQMGKTRPTIKS